MLHLANPSHICMQANKALEWSQRIGDALLDSADPVVGAAHAAVGGLLSAATASAATPGAASFVAAAAADALVQRLLPVLSPILGRASALPPLTQVCMQNCNTASRRRSF